ncbi:hypothetical protein Bca4012_060570 [Brassica carinata]
MLHRNGSGYSEAESYGNVEARFFKKLGRRSVLKKRFQKFPQASDSNSGSETESGCMTKLPYNL